MLQKAKQKKNLFLKGVEGHGELGLIATILINATYIYTENLFRLMSVTYIKVVQEKGKGSKNVNWIYINHAIREIWWEIHTVCQLHVRFKPSGKVCYSIQAWIL